MSLKIWYKYEFGYINIDEDNVYLTNTGNWSDIQSLEEKDGKNKLPKQGRRISAIVYVAIAALAVLFLIFKNFTTGNKSLIFTAGSVFGLYAVYKYFSTDVGPAFLIPKSKIVYWEMDERDLKIYFKNKSGEDDTVTLKKVERASQHELAEYLKHCE